VLEVLVKVVEAELVVCKIVRLLLKHKTILLQLAVEALIQLVSAQQVLLVVVKHQVVVLVVVVLT
tara:strand:+ start:123 stop:317 length:195 start_codon:yes stop_codon:yes gene_type:complete